MLIKNVKIRNFKCFLEEEINFCLPDNAKPGSGLNIFVGPNNSGKSSVFEIFSKWNSNNQPWIVDESDFNDAEKPIEFDIEMDWANTHGGKLEDRKFEIRKLSTGSKNSMGEFILDVIHERKDSLILHGFLYLSARRKISTSTREFFSQLVERYKTNKHIPHFETLFFGDPEKYALFFLALGNKTFGRACNLQLNGINKVHGSETDEEFYNSITKELSEILEVDGYQVRSNSGSMTLFVKQRGRWIEIEKMGSGIEQIFILVCALNAPHQTYSLFLDEPELSLHPQIQKRLFAYLKKQATTKQIFISTHSPYFIDPDLISNVFRFENHGEGRGTIVLPKTEQRKRLDDIETNFLNLDIREVFFSRKVLCVEGKTDVTLFSKFFSNIVENFHEWTIVKMNSKEEAKKFWKTLRSFCSDFKIILDLDALFGKQNNGSEMNTWRSFFDNDDLKTKIYALGKSAPLKSAKVDRCYPLLDEQLSPEELEQKNAILSSLKEENIFVLRYGMLENYLDYNGEIIQDTKSAEKEADLKAIFE